MKRGKELIKTFEKSSFMTLAHRCIEGEEPREGEVKRSVNGVVDAAHWLQVAFCSWELASGWTGITIHNISLQCEKATAQQCHSRSFKSIDM